MPPQGVTVDAQPVGNIKSPDSELGENRKLFALVAYHFPQYSLQQVEELPFRDVILLFKTMQRIEAERMLNLTLIASAPQSKNGKGVKTLMKHFQEIIDNNG